ncbi:DNA-binding protein WhiA [Nocardia sp. NPDC004260]
MDGDFGSITDVAFGELCAAPRDDRADRVELVTLVRFATGDGVLVVGSWAAAQRVCVLLGAQLKTVGRVAAVGPRARPRWRVRVADATGVRVRLGLLDPRQGRRVQGLPPEVIARLDQDAAAIVRAGFLAAGTIHLTGPVPRLQITCPTLAVALAVAGALRRVGAVTGVRHHERTGADHVAVAGIDAVTTTLAGIGAPRAAQQVRVCWDDRRRHSAHSATRKLTAANTGRAQQAAATQLAAVRAALAVLGDRVPEHLAAIAHLRLQHPQTGMGPLGKLATPPLSKDTVAGRLRRLIALADRHTTQPDTTATP